MTDEIKINCCPRGHELTVNNTYMTKVGYKRCRICMKERVDKYYRDNIDRLRTTAKIKYRERKKTKEMARKVMDILNRK